jgi:hypothetical protein
MTGFQTGNIINILCIILTANNRTKKKFRKKIINDMPGFRHEFFTTSDCRQSRRNISIRQSDSIQIFKFVIMGILVCYNSQIDNISKAKN